jgi:integrase
MSVTKKPGGRWLVRWRENGQNRGRTFDLKADADAFDREVTRRRQLGPMATEQLTSRNGPTLDQWIKERWSPEVELAETTRERYASVYGVHIEPRLGRVPVNQIDVSLLRGWQRELRKGGAGVGTVLKARAMLSGVLRYAAEEGLLPGNPLSLVRPPTPEQVAAVQPLAPVTVELIRHAILNPESRLIEASRNGQRKRVSYELPAPGDPTTWRRDALIVSLLGYTGMRPGELRALSYDHLYDDRIFVQYGTNPDGSRKPTKNRQRRNVRLLAAPAQDLREYRMAVGRPSAKSRILLNSDGMPWTRNDWNEWARDRWAPALAQAGLEKQRPYDLRHSFASLLLAERRTYKFVAGQLGHSVKVLMDTYEHLFDEYEDGAPINADEEIAKARVPATAATQVGRLGTRSAG